jgi:FkbM family methyltransferase
VGHLNRKDCIVYSFGIQKDWSFDAAIAQLGCEVWSYDPSSLQLKDHSDLDKNVHFQRVGVGIKESTRWIVEDPNHGGKWNDVDGPSVDGAHKFQIKSLRTLMQENGHDRIDLLKIDVEGTEWGLLKEWVAEKELIQERATTTPHQDILLDRIGQLVAEVHFWPSADKAHETNGEWPATERDMADILHGMGRHFDLWRREENELGFENGRAYLRGEGSCCFDVGWIKKKPFMRGNFKQI